MKRRSVIRKVMMRTRVYDSWVSFSENYLVLNKVTERIETSY